MPIPGFSLDESNELTGNETSHPPMESKRVAVGGIEHESTNFIPDPTSLEAFLGQATYGQAMARKGSANTIIDGLVTGVRKNGLELAPLSFASAIPGGLPARETYLALKHDLLSRLEDALPVDGVLLSLHGAFAAQGVDDADGDILESVRAAVGPQCPVIAVHDLHSNISQRMVDAANALIVERTYPHTDMAERGIEAARLMARILAEGLCPALGFRPLPLFWAAAKMDTSRPPMSEAVDRVRELADQPVVLSANLAVGSQWVDSPVAGASVTVATDRDAQAAQQYADELARWVWQRRDDWQREPLSPARALELGEAANRYPIVLADQADNTGGGAPGDSTEILRLFVDRNLRDAAVLYIVDPEVAAAAKGAGVGATLNVEVGGRSYPQQGPPVSMQAEVLATSDGHFTYDGPMWAGVNDSMGDSVLLRQRGVHVIVISRRQQPIDLAFARGLGLDCRRMRYLCLKSSGHFRSGFGPIAGTVYSVDATGLLTRDFRQLAFQRLGRRVYPMDADAIVEW